MSKIISIIAIALIIIGGGIVVNRLYFGDSFDLPEGGTTETETVVVEDGNIVEVGEETSMPESVKEKEIMVTDGVRHTIPLDQIVQGCPSKDCIPSIDNPVYESVGAASEWLPDEDIGLALSHEGVNRFYPYRILVTHEIVNDTINGRRILVTYCPLCFTGIVFDPLAEDEPVEFGVSGKLWNSNLVMYDRKTDTLWSQITGEAIVGKLAGAELKVIRSDTTKFGLWKNKFPSGEVLSRNTGRAFGSYERIPYGGDLTDIKPFFPVSHRDTRLPETAYVLGITLDGKAKAYHFDAVKSAGSFDDTLAGHTLRVEYDAALDAVDMFEIKPDGTREELALIPVFWFSWATTYPDTELYK